MTINDIMLRDIMEAEAEHEAEAAQKAAKKVKQGETIVRWAAGAFALLAVLIVIALCWFLTSDTPHKRGLFKESPTASEIAPSN